MDASKLARPCRVYLVAVSLCFLWLAPCGCASYFRTRALSPDELNQKNLEREQSEQQRLFEPDSNLSH